MTQVPDILLSENPAERWLRQSFCPTIHKDGKWKPERALALEGLLAVPVSVRSVERTCLCQPEVNELQTELNQMLFSISQPSSLPWQTVNSLHTAAGGKVRNVTSWGIHSHQTLLGGLFMDLCSPSAMSYLLQPCLISDIFLQGSFLGSFPHKLREVCTPGA